LKINFCRYVWKAQTKNQDYSNCISVHSPNSPMINSKKSNTSSRVDVEVVGLVNPIFSENFALKICKNKGKLQNATFWTVFGQTLEVLTNLKIFLTRCFDPTLNFYKNPCLPPPHPPPPFDQTYLRRRKITKNTSMDDFLPEFNTRKKCV